MYSKVLDDTLKEWINACGASEQILAALNYMIFPGGKRVRAHLILTLAEELGLVVSDVVSLAAAVELLHTSSLIHDDLPCLDNDDFRRGRPSCHKQFDEATALLAGDFLIAGAFYLASRVSSSNAEAAPVVTSLAQAFSNLCVGQDLDRWPPIDLKGLIRIHELKTGNLFQFCCAAPAMLRGESERRVSLWQTLGMHAGVCFQLQDDLEDLNSESTTENATSALGECIQVRKGRIKEIINDYYHRIDDILISIHANYGRSFPHTEEIVAMVAARGRIVFGRRTDLAAN